MNSLIFQPQQPPEEHPEYPLSHPLVKAMALARRVEAAVDT